MATRRYVEPGKPGRQHRVAAIELRHSTRESGYAGQAFDFTCQVPPGDATDYAVGGWLQRLLLPSITRAQR